MRRGGGGEAEGRSGGGVRVDSGGAGTRGERQAHEALSDADGDTFAPELRNCVV